VSDKFDCRCAHPPTAARITSCPTEAALISTRSSQSNSRNALNAKNASRSARIGCICAPVKRVTRHSAAIARQTGMQANTRTPADIRSSRLRSPVSAGCTVIRMTPSLSIKLWRFVYRSSPPKRFHKCCSPRGAALLSWEKRPTAAVAGQAGPWLQRLFSLNCEYRKPRVLLFLLTYAARQIFESAAPASPRLDAPLPCRSRTTSW